MNMDLGLTGKIALITGSTKRIGKAIAIEMAKEGTNVIINGRKKKQMLIPLLAKLKSNYQILILKGQHTIFPKKKN